MAKKSVSDKKAELLAELKKLETLEREEEQKSFAIVGRVVMDEMETNADLDSQISKLLEAKLSKNSEREMFGLEKLSSNRGRPKAEN